MIPAFLAAALPALIDAAPSLIRIFGKGKQSETNAQAAEKVAEIAKAVTGATTEQEAVQKIAADPAVKEAFQQRIREQWFELQEAGGGGIAAARDFGLKSSETPMYRQPALLISLVLLVPVFMLLSDVFYVHPDAYSGELRVQIVTAVLTIIGLVAAYWLGSSMSSRTKDEIIAGKRD